MSEIRVQDYSDYRLYLSEYFRAKKLKNPNFTWGSWARRLGLKNNTSLLKIVNGQREAGPAIQKSLSSYFSFNNYEKDYFEKLVRISKLKRKDPEASLALYNRITQRAGKSVRREIDLETFQKVSEWVFYFLRQAKKIGMDCSQPETVMEKMRFPLPKGQIKNAIRVLKESGLESTTMGLGTQNDIASMAIQRYHKSVLDLAKLALDEVPVEQREYQASVLSVKKSDIPKLKLFLRDLMDEVDEKFESKNPSESNEIYQIQIQAFPLSK
jgi:uncharacterized protein (TIGR02147 family)